MFVMVVGWISRKARKRNIPRCINVTLHYRVQIKTHPVTSKQSSLSERRPLKMANKLAKKAEQFIPTVPKLDSAPKLR